MRVKRFRLKDGCEVPERVFVHLAPSITLNRETDDSHYRQIDNGAPWDVARFCILDEYFCQPYMPFYQAFDEEPCNEICASVVRKYNETMAGFDWLEEVPDGYYD